MAFRLSRVTINQREAYESWRTGPLETLDLAHAVVDFASDIKGENIVLMDMRQVSPIADYFVIVTGTSERQLKAIVGHIAEEVKKQYGISAWRTEGEAQNGWVLIDFADIVVHAFLPEKRSYYDLEGLWHGAPVMVRMQ